MGATQRVGTTPHGASRRCTRRFVRRQPRPVPRPRPHVNRRPVGLHEHRARLVGPEQSEAYICHPSDVGFAAAGCITGRLLEKFPKLRIGFSHGGGTLAAFLPRLQSGWTKLAPLSKGFASPTETARKFYYDNLAFDPRLLRYLMDTFGETQIFVGSDYPFMAGQKDSAKTFDPLGLNQAQLDRVLFENAARFLNLKD